MKLHEITNDQFDSKLAELVSETPAGHLLTIPGVYEILSEWFNNDIIDALTEDDGSE